VPIQDLDVIWDREVAYELLGERHLSDVIWDREVAHEMNISELNVLEEHAIGNGTLYMQTISAVSAEVEENMQSKDVRVGMTATRSIDGIVMEHATSTTNKNGHAARVEEKKPTREFSHISGAFFPMAFNSDSVVLIENNSDDTIALEEKSIAIKMDGSLAVEFFTHFKWLCSDLNHKKAGMLDVQELNFGI
jgi:hypothetical protein